MLARLTLNRSTFTQGQVCVCLCFYVYVCVCVYLMTLSAAADARRLMNLCVKPSISH